MRGLALDVFCVGVAGKLLQTNGLPCVLCVAEGGQSGGAGPTTQNEMAS